MIRTFFNALMFSGCVIILMIACTGSGSSDGKLSAAQDTIPVMTKADSSVVLARQALQKDS